MSGYWAAAESLYLEPVCPYVGLDGKCAAADRALT